MSNSSLISCTVLSPNHSGKRTMPIDRISIHCMAGNLSVESCGSLFAKSSRQASSQYGIGSDGRIGLYVDEANRSWCTSSKANDQRAVTIEVANTVAAHPWPVSDKAYAALIKLCVDICKRNGKTKVVWFPDKDTALAYEPKEGEMVLTVHRWFAAKACPGDDLFNDHPDIVKKVNAQLGTTSAETPAATTVLYRVQVGAFSAKANADKQLEKVKAAGFDTYMVKVGNLYKIQVGAFGKRANADAMMKKLKAAGFSAFITTQKGEPVDIKEEKDAEAIAVGKKVKVKNGAKTYTGGSLASFVYKTTYEVLQISGNRVVIGLNGKVTAAVKASDLTLV